MRCSHCQTLWPDELAGMLKFCGTCGAPMAALPTLPASPPLASEPGGELRFVTVLFADLAGSTAFAEERAADDVAATVGELLQRLGRVVEQHGGAVDKFLGDAVMATFGLPRPDPNAARNAVRAGLAMHAATAQFCREYQLAFHLRIGLHAGEVMFRALGNSWTVMGDTVNTASRIQNEAALDKVWISRPVYEEVRRFFMLIPRPAVELKGKKQSVQPYEVVAERASPSIDLPPFVGREREWAQMHSILQSAIDDQTLRALLVHGPAGIGKSRLIYELRDWIQRQPDMYRLNVVQYDHSERLPAHGLNALIRSRFDLPLALSDDEVVARLREQMPQENLSIEPGREELAVEFFAFVLGVLRPDFNIHNMDGRGQWDGAYVEIKQWLEGRARRTPWLLILEDVQKGDADTAAFLDWALRVTWTAPVLIIATVRAEDFDSESYWHEPVGRWLTTGAIAEIRLRELPPDVLAQTLIAMIEGSVPSALARRIAEHTEGNPLFATELVLLLKDQGLLNAETEWRRIQLPGTIREVMEARLERLGVEGKEVAKRGALMGRRFTRDAIERIWERATLELDNGLHVLKETETIYEESSKLFAGEMEEVFRHGRFQEAALARIPRDERLRWLQGLEEWAGARLGHLGEHWESAGAVLVPLIARSREEHQAYWEASLWYEVLGLLHRKHYHLPEAIEALSKALEPARGKRRLIVCQQLAEVKRFAGDLAGALQTLEQAGEPGPESVDHVPPVIQEKLISLTADPLLRWDSIELEIASLGLGLTLASVLLELARTAEAQSAFKAIAARLESVTDQNGARLWLRWGRDYAWFLSDLLGQAQAAQDECQRLRRRIHVEDPALEAERLSFLYAESAVATALGRYDRVAAILNERFLLAQAMRDLRAEREVWNSRGIMFVALGELSAATRCYEQALALSRAIGHRRGEAIALHNLGEQYYQQGQWDLAQQYQEQYLELSRTIGNRIAEAYGRVSLAAVAIERGRHVLAEQLLAEVDRLAEENGWSQMRGVGQGYRGLLNLRRWLEGRDRVSLQQAIADLQTSEGSWRQSDEAGEFYMALIAALALSGDDPGARAMLTQARGQVHETWLASRQWLNIAQALIDHQPLETPLTWFKEHDFVREVSFTHRLQQAQRGP